jgi:hypothetical protein
VEVRVTAGLPGTVSLEEEFAEYVVPRKIIKFGAR